MTEQQALGARLRAARENAGMSQGQVARAMGLHRPSVTWIEQGTRKVSALELDRLATLYGVHITVLLGNAGQSQDKPRGPDGRPLPLGYG